MMPSLHSALISKTLVIYFTLFLNVFKNLKTKSIKYKFVYDAANAPYLMFLKNSFLLFNATTNLNGYIADICILYTKCYK